MRISRLRAGAVGLAGLLLAGCGIRGTSVPVDAGPAPSRASCEAPGEGRTSQLAGRVPLTVFLMCATQVRPVHRSTQESDAPTSTRPLDVARELLDQLQEDPTAAETQAGFGTEMPAELQVNGPAHDDPRHTLRLSLQPEELPPYALAQLVCTFSTSAATSDRNHSVVLGGPERAVPLQRYTCGQNLREHPEIALSSGAPVR
ncbi:hypothetical protein [Streptomyces palmae]|uniref:Lipoprotein n=1 Tax=Streptomyces palmae TaxID=1701085 RepID=A0A4Z0G4M5_9ACTN|nr:hypothetical protein [Streptomyces palmae]TGA89726.1 hypothetical protein E4099_29085 [Streptomyces palmae]